MYKVKLEYYFQSQNKVSAEIFDFAELNKLIEYMISLGEHLKMYGNDRHIIHIDIYDRNRVSISSIQGETGAVISYIVDHEEETVWRSEICNLPDYFSKRLSSDLRLCLL